MTSYEERLQSMLDRVTNDVDKREGSFIYDGLAPCAFAITELDFEQDNFIDLLMPDTAIGEYLDRVVYPHLTRKAASNAVRKMTTSETVAIGSKWQIESLSYTVTELISTKVYKVECDTAGEIGNQYSGSADPLTLSESGKTASITDIITAGSDTETDDALRERYYNLIRYPVTSGNANNYKKWALEVAGVGAAKVLPLESGAGTVTVLILDDEYKIDATIIDDVQNHIDAVRPIGATVTVKSPTNAVINISGLVTLDGTRTLTAVKTDFSNDVSKYLTSIMKSNYTIPNENARDSIKVSIAKIGNILLETDGVSDYSNLTLNGGGNVTLTYEKICSLGTVTLAEE